MTFLQCTFKPFKTHILRVNSGTNNPFILCLNEMKFLGVSSKGRRRFLMPFIYQKKLNPLEQSGCKGQPCHPSGQQWHPVTCHIPEDCTDCKAWHCFPFELRTTQSPQASSETGEGQGKNLFSTLTFPGLREYPPWICKPQGRSPSQLPCSRWFALGISAPLLCPSHWPALMDSPAPRLSSLILSALEIIGENPIHRYYGGFQCFHLRKMKAWLNF